MAEGREKMLSWVTSLFWLELQSYPLQSRQDKWEKGRWWKGENWRHSFCPLSSHLAGAFSLSSQIWHISHSLGVEAATGRGNFVSIFIKAKILPPEGCCFTWGINLLQLYSYIVRVNSFWCLHQEVSHFSFFTNNFFSSFFPDQGRVTTQNPSCSQVFSM